MIGGPCPYEIQQSLARYVQGGVPTGDGLRRILENRPVFEVLGGLDLGNTFHLPGILSHIYANVPIDAWGSAAKVERWIAHGGEGRRGGGDQ